MLLALVVLHLARENCSNHLAGWEKTKKKRCLSKSRDQCRDHSRAHICSGRSSVFAGMCFREVLTAGCFTKGRVRRRNFAEGFLQLAVGALQPPAPSLMGTHS